MKNTTTHCYVMQDQLRVALGAARMAKGFAETNPSALRMTIDDCINALEKLDVNLAALVGQLAINEK